MNRRKAVRRLADLFAGRFALYGAVRFSFVGFSIVFGPGDHLYFAFQNAEGVMIGDAHVDYRGGFFRKASEKVEGVRSHLAELGSIDGASMGLEDDIRATAFRCAPGIDLKERRHCTDVSVPWIAGGTGTTASGVALIDDTEVYNNASAWTFAEHYSRTIEGLFASLPHSDTGVDVLRARVYALVKQAGIPAERIHVLTKDDIANGEPSTGVLVTVTVWSGSSRMMLAHVAQVLAAEEFQRVPLYFIDGDEYNEVFDGRPKLSDAEQKLVSHGNGEVFWFLNGLLVRRLDIHSKNPEQDIAAFSREQL